jgi:hypothetical protein
MLVPYSTGDFYADYLHEHDGGSLEIRNLEHLPPRLRILHTRVHTEFG